MPDTTPPLLSEQDLCNALPNVTVEWQTAKAIARAIESATRTPLLARIAELEALREWQQVEINRLYSERDQLRAQVAATTQEAKP